MFVMGNKWFEPEAARYHLDGGTSTCKAVRPEWPLVKAQNFLAQTFAATWVGVSGEDNLSG